MTPVPTEAVGATAPKASRRLPWSALVRVALLALGVGVIVVLVRRVGAAAVWAILGEAGPWVPVIMVLEAAWYFGADLTALRALAGRVPLRDAAHATAVSYSFAILAPGGRATGEVARSSLLTRHMSVGQAATVGAHMHGASLGANACMCALLFCAVAWSSGVRATLSVVLAANAVLVGGAALGIVLLARNARIRGWMAARQRFAALKLAATEGQVTSANDADPSALPRGAALGRAILGIVGGRLIQTVQYGCALAAVGGAWGAVPSAVTHAIHLVAANVGDIVPGQVGVTESSYATFASYIGLGDAPERALSLPLLVRLCQIALAALCIAVATLRPKPPAAPTVAAGP